MELLLKWWNPIWAVVVTLGLLSMGLLSKTYARKEDVSALSTQVDRMQGQLDEMPSTRELHTLNMEISDLKGQLKALEPQLQSLHRQFEILIENELSERGHKR